MKSKWKNKYKYGYSKKLNPGLQWCTVCLTNYADFDIFLYTSLYLCKKCNILRIGKVYDISL